MVHEDITNGKSVKMDWHQVKAQVVFQPDAPVGLLSIFELPGVDQIKLAPWITPTAARDTIKRLV